MTPTGIELWLCDDCTMVAVNDDSTGIESDKRARKVRAAVADLGPHLVNWSADPNDPDDCDEHEFSWSACDCCCECLGGHRTRFTTLEE